MARVFGLALTLLLPAAAAWAGPPMSSATNAITRDADDAGGLTATSGALSTNNTLTGAIGEAVAVTTTTSGALATNNRLRGGFLTIASYPGAVTALTPLSDVTTTSATVQWATPSYDGSLGTLQPGSSYILQVASYTTPSVFGAVGFISVQVSTFGMAAGSVVGSGATSLVPNTTYFIQLWTMDNDADVSAPFMSTFTTLATTPTFTGANLFFAVHTASYTTSIASVAVAWNALPQAPPDASSKTCEGYVLVASSNNFGALAPPGAPVFSSTTYNVLASTLTLGTTVALDLSSTYYFKVGTLNWSGRVNYTTSTFELVFSVQQSTGLLHLGTIDPNVARSTVSTSSMVVTNTGNWPATIGLWASTATLPSSPWTLATSSGPDQAVLLGLWNSGTVGPPASAFSTALTTTTRYSANGGNYAGNQSGYQLAPGQSATLWFLFWLPASTSSLGPETVRVTPQPVYP